MPKELDVPHWAINSILNYRQRMECPPWLTDRMIYSAMLVVDNDEAKRAELLRDLAIVTYLMQQKAHEVEAEEKHNGKEEK